MKILFILFFPVILLAQIFTPVEKESKLFFTFNYSENKESFGFYQLTTGQRFPVYKSDGSFLLLIPAHSDSISVTDLRFKNYQAYSFSDITFKEANTVSYKVFSAKYYQGQRYFPLRIYPYRKGQGSLGIPGEISLSLTKMNYPAQAFSLQSKKVQTHNPYTDWYKFTITENAVYKVSKSDLDNWNIDVDNPEDLHFFSQNGQMLPFKTNTDFPTKMPELPVFISNHVPGDGWSSNETLYLFVRGANFFHYDSVKSVHKFHHHFYDKKNYLWLAVDPNISNPEIQVINRTNPTSSQDHALAHDHVEKDEVNRLKSGTTWFENARGQANNPHIINLTLDNALICYDCANPSLGIKLALAGGNRFLYHDPNSFTHYFNVDFETASNIIPLVVNYPVSNANFATINTSYQLTDLVSGPKIRINYTPVPRVSDGSVSPELGKYYFDFYELSYPVKLVDHSEQIYFTVDFTSAPITFDFNNIPDDGLLWNITDANTPVISTVTGNDDFVPYFRINRKNSFTYVSSPNAPALPAPEIVRYTHHLRDINQDGDLIIITPQVFYDKSLEYAQAREQWATEPFKVEVVALEDIYKEFSSGIKDVGAIRNFLKYIWENRTQPPSYVLLMGDGNYDPKEIIFTNKDRDLIPTFQIDNALEISSFATDFYYADLNQTSNSYTSIEPEIPLGRLPVSTESEIDNYIEKLQNYGQLTQSNGWEQDFLLIADDLDGGDSKRETFHYIGAERINSNIPGRYNVFKLYMEKYPAVSGGIGRIKPAATTDFLNKVNQGQSIVIYIGHGAPDKWAHETLYDLKLHRDQISNNFTNGLWMALSCDISKFDDPGRPTMGEDLVNRNKSGAMWVFASTRLVTAFENNELGVRIVQWLLTKPAQYTVGEALTLGVQDFLVNNTLKYVLFGDPSLPLLEGRLPVTFTNLSELDTLKSLQKVNISGYVGSSPGEYADYNGTAVLRAYDVIDSLIHPGFASDEWYTTLGPSLYKGQLTITDGAFNAQFIVPKSIKYSPNPEGKIWLYTWEPVSGIKASTYLDDVVFYGSSGNIVDFEGPEISISIDDINFGVEGDLIPQSSELFVYLIDSSGINVSGEVGHEISMLIDGKDKVDLTDFFVYNANSAFQGKIRYPLASLEEGQHEILIRAWDNANNPTEYSFNFKIVQAGVVTLENVVNYPNPMQGETWFTCQTSAVTGSIDINIYTLSGRKVKTLHKNIDQIDFQRVYWDGKDEYGNTLANGTYLYHFQLTSGDKKLRKTEKLVIIN